MCARVWFLVAVSGVLCAEDWPEWRGAGRRGEWRENGIIRQFPSEGLPVRWRVPVKGGYSGPAVAGGKVFITDYENGSERLLAIEEATGRILWSHSWKAEYRGLEYPSGPRATPTVDGDRVYALGAMGHLWCMRANDGRAVWSRDFQKEFGTMVPAWGMTAAPLVIENILIAVVGGRPDSKVVAFDKKTGRELWRALSSEDSEPGYSQPFLTSTGRLIVWHAGAISCLDSRSGKVFWEHPFRIHMSTPIATPVESGPFVLVSAFFQGSRLLRQDSGELIWGGTSDSERNTDTLHALLGSPVINDGYIYGVCNYGQLRCLKLSTGERVWESQQATVERARNVSAYLVHHRDRTVIFNDRGELILARLRPAGYEEISRTQLIRPTSKQGSRRELGAVAWSHPAFANRHIVVRNDEEVIRVSAEQIGAAN